MPAVSGDIQITYGGFAVGGDTDRLIDDFTTHNVGKDVAAVEFSFWVSGDTAEDFASACKTAESNFRTPYQDLIVVFGQSQVLALKQSNSTGLDAVPEIRKTGEEGDSGRSRRYTVRIEFGIPADKASMSGRRESSIEVEFSPSRRRTVTFSGVWTAVGSSDARAQYNSASGTWVTAALTALGGTYEKVEEVVTESTNDKTVDFRVVHKEILRAQSGSGTDDTGLVDPTLVITRRHVGPGVTVSPKATPLVEFECLLESGVDHDVATNLETKWDAIKTWLVNQVKAYLDGGDFAVTELTPDFDEHEHRLSVRMVAVGTDTGASTLSESILTVRDEHQIGKEFVPAWTGNPFSAYVYDGPAVLRRSISWQARYIGFKSQYEVSLNARANAALNLQKPYTAPNPSRGSWILDQSDAQTEQSQIGASPWTMKVTDVQATNVYRWVSDVGGRGAVATESETAGQPLQTETTPPAGRRSTTQ